MKRRVLVVDDELGTRRILDYLLSQYYEVKTFINGLDAIDWLSEGHLVDLIITDCEMPIMDGVAFVETLRKSAVHQDIPVIVISSEKPDLLKVEFVSLDVSAFLTKPIQPKTLFWRVEEGLSKSVNY